MRATLSPPLYDMKHLKIEFALKMQYDMVELMDSLLWLSPYPDTISFIEHNSQALTKSIKVLNLVSDSLLLILNILTHTSTFHYIVL